MENSQEITFVRGGIKYTIDISAAPLSVIIGGRTYKIVSVAEKILRNRAKVMAYAVGHGCVAAGEKDCNFLFDHRSELPDSWRRITVLFMGWVENEYPDFIRVGCLNWFVGSHLSSGWAIGSVPVGMKLQRFPGYYMARRVS